MALVLGLMVCLTVWWLSQKGDGFGRRLGRALGQGVGAVTGPIPMQRIGGGLALAVGGILMLRGNLVPAALLGLGGLWLIEGSNGIASRLRRLVPRRAAAGRRYRTAMIEAVLLADGRVAEGCVASGRARGTRLDDMPPASVVDLLASCRGRDPEGVALLEAYLDRRAPGWRVHAQGDRDPRTGRPPDPGAMTQEEAYQVLGLQRGASSEEVRTAHRSLMKRTHPDQGGSAERAARVNAARDRLLSRHR